MKENTYDIFGTDYNLTRQADPFIADRLYYLLNPDKDKLYLDIGCGTGNYTIELVEKGLNFYGVDPSEKMLKVAQSRNQKINRLVGTAEQIPTNKNIFDGVIAVLTVHHCFAGFDKLVVHLQGQAKNSAPRTASWRNGT